MSTDTLIISNGCTGLLFLVLHYLDEQYKPDYQKKWDREKSKNLGHYLKLLAKISILNPLWYCTVATNAWCLHQQVNSVVAWFIGPLFTFCLIIGLAIIVEGIEHPPLLIIGLPLGLMFIIQITSHLYNIKHGIYNIKMTYQYFVG